jgi:hypothetical protein
MSPRRRRRRGVPLWAALAVFAVMFAFGVAVDAVEHLALLAVACGPAVVAFWAGRRYERRRSAAPRPAQAVPRGPDRAAQVAELERLAARPIEAVIESYKVIQRKYGGRA